MQATTKPGADVVVSPQGKAPTLTVFTDAGNGVLEKQVLQIPTTHEEMQALLTRRRQISDQLESVTDRRSGLIEQLRVAPDEAKSGLQAQLNVLDARVVQLETDLGTVGREIAAASPELISMAQAPSPPPGSDDFEEGMAAAGIPLFFIMSAVYFVSRRRWKRQARRAPPMLPAVEAERLQRVENGIEAMAIEIERISEGQRFVTKLLSESRGLESTPR
ncbi:MAG TPA: hypothetical protein VJ852_00675 [Gemmatimonadaceae bacterium]|nr:hypothetical protein [Gemmatimonadaceae bacterium]